MKKEGYRLWKYLVRATKNEKSWGEEKSIGDLQEDKQHKKDGKALESILQLGEEMGKKV